MQTITTQPQAHCTPIRYSVSPIPSTTGKVEATRHVLSGVNVLYAVRYPDGPDNPRHRAIVLACYPDAGLYHDPDAPAHEAWSVEKGMLGVIGLGSTPGAAWADAARCL